MFHVMIAFVNKFKHLIRSFCCRIYNFQFVLTLLFDLSLVFFSKKMNWISNPINSSMNNKLNWNAIEIKNTELNNAVNVKMCNGSKYQRRENKPITISMCWASAYIVSKVYQYSWHSKTILTGSLDKTRKMLVHVNFLVDTKITVEISRLKIKIRCTRALFAWYLKIDQLK